MTEVILPQAKVQGLGTEHVLGQIQRLKKSDVKKFKPQCQYIIFQNVGLERFHMFEIESNASLMTNYNQSSWSIRPNPEDRIYNKPDDQIIDQTNE